MTTARSERGASLRISLTSRSTEQTRDLASAMAEVAAPGDRIALLGPLGAGKTQFAKGFAVGLGIEAVVNSPSFTLMTEYEGRVRLFHQDLYRLAGTADVLTGGLLDERQDDGVTLSEWADRFDDSLDSARLTVDIEPRGDDVREIALSGQGAVAARYLAAAERWLDARGQR